MLLLLATLQQLPKQIFPTVPSPGTAIDIAAAVTRDCPPSRSTDATALLREEQRLNDSVLVHTGTAGLVQLGCVRARLAAANATSREGFLMPMGKSWGDGGIAALLEALHRSPVDARAADLLAVLELDRRDEAVFTRTSTALAPNIKAQPSPAMLRVCSDIELRLGHEDAARTCALNGLKTGNDSSWHLLRLARIAFHAADTTAGIRDFLAAARAAHGGEARDEIEWQLQWFVSPDEETIAKTLNGDALAAWIGDRLAERDVRDGQPFGARLAEHFKRLDYALSNFGLHYGLTIKGARGPNAATPENGLPPDTVRAFCEPGLVPARPYREYQRWQSEIDDRGIVWLRFGAPEKRVTAQPSCGPRVVPDQSDTVRFTTEPVVDPVSKLPANNTREVWRYTIDGKTLLLNFEGEAFSGSVGASRLVSGVLGSYLCDVDATRCELTELSKSSLNAKRFGPAAFVKPEQVEAIRRDDQANIAIATTTDDNSVRADKNIDLTSRLHRLWDPLSGTAIALVTYALPVHDLSVQNGSERTTVVDLELRQWNPVANEWHDTTVTRRFTLPDTSVKRPAVTGFLVIPAASEVTAWSVVARQVDGRRGRAYDVGHGGLGTGSVAISDLVIGSEAQGLTWNFHNVPIPLAATNAIDRTKAVSLYYQVRSTGGPSELQTTLAIYKTGSSDSTAALEVSYRQELHDGINEVGPSLDVSRLERGKYTLEVRLTDAAGKVVVRRRAVLTAE